jgi:hypothetical protein
VEKWSCERPPLTLLAIERLLLLSVSVAPGGLLSASPRRDMRPLPPRRCSLGSLPCGLLSDELPLSAYTPHTATHTHTHKDVLGQADACTLVTEPAGENADGCPCHSSQHLESPGYSLLTHGCEPTGRDSAAGRTVWQEAVKADTFLVCLKRKSAAPQPDLCTMYSSVDGTA